MSDINFSFSGSPAEEIFDVVNYQSDEGWVKVWHYGNIPQLISKTSTAKAGNGNMAKRKVYQVVQRLFTCAIIPGTFLCRPLQWPNSALSDPEKMNNDAFFLIFVREFNAMFQMQFRVQFQ